MTHGFQEKCSCNWNPTIKRENIKRLGPNSVIDEEDMNNSQQQPQTSTSRIVPPTSPTAPRFFDWFDQAGCWYLAQDPLEPCSALRVTDDRREGYWSRQLQDAVFLFLLLLLLLMMLFTTSWHMYIIISHRPSNKGSPPWLLCSSSSFAVESDLWLVSTRTWRVEAASGKKFGPFNDSREIGTWKSVAPRHPSNSVRSHTLWRSSASWIAMISRMNCQVFNLRLSGI